MQAREAVEQEKGLFTFYKQQEIQQDLLRLKMKKRGKNKNKKSKKKLKSQNKSDEVSVFVIAEDNEEEQQNVKPKQAFQQFLKNIRHHNPDISSSNSCQKPSYNRLKTEPNSGTSRPKDSSLRAIKKTKVLSQLSQKYNFLPPKEFSPVSQPSFSPISDLINACQKFYKQSPIHFELNQSRSEQYEHEKRKLLERLKSLEAKNKSNLISSRESINLRESALKERCESENKNFFNHVATNSIETGDKNTYKLLKDALKLPQIKKQIMHTQVTSPTSSQKKLAIAAKNMPYQRKEMRLKHSNERRREFYKLNLVAELTQSKNLVDGPTINLIDMSKDYKKDESNSQEWHIKRKIIKSKLGIQL